MGIIKVLQNAVNLADFTVQGCGSAQGIAARNTANSWFSYFSSSATPDVTCSNAVLKLEQAQNALSAEIQRWSERALGAGILSSTFLTANYSKLYNAIDSKLDSMIQS